MSKDVSIKVKVDTAKGVKNVSDLNDEIINTEKSLNGLKATQKKLTDELAKTKAGSDEYKKLKKQLDGVSGKLKKIESTSGKSLKGLSTGFKGVGLAIKATGIGLLLSAFQALKRILEEQQPVLDLVETTFTAIGIAIGIVKDILVDTFKAQSDANGGFDATTKIISNLITVALTPLKLSFLSLKAGILALQLAWESSWFGSGDEGRIQEIKDDLADVGDDIIQLKDDVIDASISIVENFGEMTDEVGGFVSGVVDGIKEVDAAQIIADAKATTRAKNRAKIAEAVNKGLLENFDRIAEGERQLRDNTTLSIEDRIKANNALGETLEQQERLMLANAKIGVRAAALELKANDTVENRVALINAKNEVAAVEATIQGFRSEQLINQIALEKELNDATQTTIDRTAQRNIDERNFNAQRIKDAGDRAKALKDNLEIERTTELKRLEDIKNNTEEGTQARVDAEQDYLDAVQDFDQRQIELNEQTNAEIQEANEKAADDELNTERELTEAKIQERLRRQEQIVDISTQGANLVNDTLAEIQQRNSEQRLARIGEEYNKEQEALTSQLANKEISQRQFDAKSRLAEQKKTQLELIEKRKAFRREKGFALTKIGIELASSLAKIGFATASANAMALATPQAVATSGLAAIPVIAANTANGLTQGGIATALAGVQAGLIASQKFKAARGGVVPGSPSMIDSVDALLAPGEMVINSQSSQMFPQLLSQINQAGGGISLAPDLPVTQGGGSSATFRENEAQPTIKAIVVESDITDSQKKVSRMEKAASFG